MSRRGEWVTIVFVLLLAAVLRFWMLSEVPPGLCHDEVTNGLIAHDILARHQAVYFIAGNGRETLFHHILAITITLFGDHWLGLRYPSVALGLLCLATTYVLIRRLFGVSIALLTGGWLAISFWPIFYARVSLRAISLPFIAALSAYFLLRAAKPSPSRSANSRSANWMLAGVFLGLSLYTYTSARILPIILVTFLAYLFLVHRSTPIPWSRLLMFLLTAAVVSVPLVAWLATHPGVEYRIPEVRQPLDRLFAGDPSLVWQNLIANLKFFTCVGDPWTHYNFLRRPVFADAVGAALFCAGLLIALWRWRTPQHAFLLIWLLGALVPSIVTAVPPSSVRNILGLVVVFVFPALALVEAGRWITQRMHDARHRILVPRFLFSGSCFLLLAPCLLLTINDYFIHWPTDDAVRFFYQTDLTAIARWVDKLPSITPVAVAGLSVHSMDGPGLDLAARRDVTDIRLCDTREALVIPAGRGVWLFVPQGVPFDPALEARLLEWGAVTRMDSRAAFASYLLSDDAALRSHLARLENTVSLPEGMPVTLPVPFGEWLAFLGYEWLGQRPTPGDSPALLTYWRVEEPSPTRLKVFVHLIGERSNTPIAQHDGLGSPPHGWAAGDLIIQKHIISIPADLPAGQYSLQMGVYDTVTNVRSFVLAADRLLLYAFEVTE